MANTIAFTKWYVCPVSQNAELTQPEYEGLDWVEIKSIGNIGETGKSTNMLNYNTLDDSVTQKAKGMTDAGSPSLEVARLPTDPGQEILREAGGVGNNNNYAFKQVCSDGPVGGTGTVIYNRGLVSGPTRPNGGNEDFDVEVFTLGLQQEEIVVKPSSAGQAPVMTVAPAVSGTAQVGETLTCSNGTFTGDPTISYTYQWFANGIAVAGETGNSLELKESDLNKIFACRVTATNSAGSAFGFSNTTEAVIGA
jgi:hypothetical protein